MELRTLPEVVDRMVDFLMRENGCVTRITEGFGNGPEQMQITFSLAERIRNERHGYLNRVQVTIQSGIKSGSLIVRDYSGLPLDGSLVFDPDTPMPALCADLEDVKSWINAAWKDPARVKLFMATFRGEDAPISSSEVNQEPGRPPDQVKAKAYAYYGDLDRQIDVARDMQARGVDVNKKNLVDELKQLSDEKFRGSKTGKEAWRKKIEITAIQKALGIKQRRRSERLKKPLNREENTRFNFLHN